MLDCVNSFYLAPDTLQIDIYACATAKESWRDFNEHGKRLGESEGVNGNFVAFLAC